MIINYLLICYMKLSAACKTVIFSTFLHKRNNLFILPFPKINIALFAPT